MLKEILVSAALAIGQTPSVIDGDTVKLAGTSITTIHQNCSARSARRNRCGMAGQARAAGVVNAGRSQLAQNEFQAHAMRVCQLWTAVRRSYDRWEAACRPHDRAQICHTLHLPTGLMPEEGRLV